MPLPAPGPSCPSERTSCLASFFPDDRPLTTGERPVAAESYHLLFRLTAPRRIVTPLVVPFF
ncbi:MAG: hypothetical protein ACLFVO_15455 [Chloroflexaceae bacterium]